MVQSEKTGALITAAGLSSRMGALKQTLPIGGMTVVEMIVSRFLEAGVSDIAVVVGHRADEIRGALKAYPVTILENPDYAQTEMFDSVKIGLRYMEGRCGRLFFTPVDVPLFGLSTLKKEMSEDAPVVYPTVDGRRGHPILISSDLISRILTNDGSGGLRGALNEFEDEAAFVEVSDEGTLIDADTPEDYRKILDLYEKKKREHSL